MQTKKVSSYFKLRINAIQITNLVDIADSNISYINVINYKFNSSRYFGAWYNAPR